MSSDVATVSAAETDLDRNQTIQATDVQIAVPVAEDAAEVHALIAACPPLDRNSLYANLIQCTHFAQSCAVARSGGKVVGWISGHRPPAIRSTYFLWQVAVHPEARGIGLARKMLADILGRADQSGIVQMQTSITRSNEASWALFQGISAWLSAPLREELWFDREQHFRGQNDSEFLVTVGPFAMSGHAA